MTDKTHKYDAMAQLHAPAAAAMVMADKFVEIGQLIALEDGLGTIFCDWNELRYKLPAGTKVYACLPPQPDRNTNSEQCGGDHAACKRDGWDHCPRCKEWL